MIMDNFGVRFADKIIIRREADTVIVRFSIVNYLFPHYKVKSAPRYEERSDCI